MSQIHINRFYTCSYSEPDESNPHSPILLFNIKCNINLPSMLRIYGFSHNNSVWISLLPRKNKIPHSSHYSRFYDPCNIWRRVQTIKLLMQFIQSPVPSYKLVTNIFLSTLFSKTLSLFFYFDVKDQIDKYKSQFEWNNRLCQYK
jgi:hypothetical protein